LHHPPPADVNKEGVAVANHPNNMARMMPLIGGGMESC
jgi:hypothetical protein